MEQCAVLVVQAQEIGPARVRQARALHIPREACGGGVEGDGIAARTAQQEVLFVAAQHQQVRRQALRRALCKQLLDGVGAAAELPLKACADAAEAAVKIDDAEKAGLIALRDRLDGEGLLRHVGIAAQTADLRHVFVQRCDARAEESRVARPGFLEAEVPDPEQEFLFIAPCLTHGGAARQGEFGDAVVVVDEGIDGANRIVMAEQGGTAAGQHEGDQGAEAQSQLGAQSQTIESGEHVPGSFR